MKKALFLFLISAGVCLNFSCSKEDENLTDTYWRYAKNGIQEQIFFPSETRYELKKGTNKADAVEFYTGNYTRSGQTVTLYFSDTIPITGTISDKKMIFNYGEEKIFIKQ